MAFNGHISCLFPQTLVNPCLLFTYLVVWKTFYYHLTFHFDMKLPEQILQFALERAHVLDEGEKR